MRLTSLLLSFLVAACTSTSQDTGDTPDRVEAMRCGISIDDSCGSGGCNRTLDAAEQDRQLCSPGFPGVLINCGEFQVVAKSEVDTTRSYYYRHGQLAAIVSHLAGATFSTCMAGPADFEAPRCRYAQSVPLPACSAQP